MSKSKRKAIGRTLSERFQPPPALGDTVMGACVDCGEPQFLRDEYIVRGNIWEACGMHGWDAGHLHRQCLERRLGRDLTADDLLVTVASETPTSLKLRAHADYRTSPEYLNRR